MPDRPFCWILGSGASVESGIPTGSELAIQWLKELHELEDFQDQPLEKWATEKNLGIKRFKFEKAAAFYPWIYQRRFRDDPEAGYAFLEKAMDSAEPSYGYSVLAQIMASTPHKAAITTNFDNLVADALSIYTGAFPLVCGHESLAGYIRAKLRRPLIAKIHRDLLLNPLSEPGHIEKLSDGWENALKLMFSNFTPIVIGYGGNDGSLMGFIRTLESIPGGIYWCHRPSDEPTAAINEVVERHRGRFVQISGFDELMLRFAQKLSLQPPILELKRNHESRVENWERQLKALEAKLSEEDRIRKVLREVRENRGPWDILAEGLADVAGLMLVNSRVNQKEDPAEREKIFRELEGIYDGKVWFWHAFADFLWHTRQKYQEADDCFRKALELDSDNKSVDEGYNKFLKEHPEFAE